MNESAFEERLSRWVADPDSVEMKTLLDDLKEHRGNARKAAVRTARRAIKVDSEEPSRLVSQLANHLNDDDIYRRRGAAELIAAIGVQDASLIRTEVDRIAMALTDPITTSYAEHALAAVGRDAPQDLSPALAPIGTLLKSSSPDKQDAALHLLEYLIAEKPSVPDEDIVRRLIVLAMVEPPEDQTGEKLDRGTVESIYRRQKRAVGILMSLAQSDPDPFRQHLPTIRDGLPNLSPSARVAVLELLIPIAEIDPGAMHPLLETLGEVFKDASDSRIQVRAGWILSLSGEAYPREVAAAIEADIEAAFSLLDGDIESRAAGATLLSYVAEYNPELLAPRNDQLRSYLDDDHEAVRISIVWALGALDASENLIRIIAETDESALVRDVATAIVEGDAEPMS